MSAGAEGVPVPADERRTDSGIEIKPVYDWTDTADADWPAELGAPGEFPFTRGIYPDMYRGRLWTMRQYAGFASAEDSNARYRYLLECGQTGLSVAFDLPTQMGYDSDHPLSDGEVGKVGVAIDSLADMETLFAGIPLATGVDLDDHQRSRRRAAAHVRTGGRAAGRRPARAARHHPERHPQGVRRPRHLHLPAGAVDAADHRHLRLLPRAAAPMEHHLDLGLPHPRSGRRPRRRSWPSPSPTASPTSARPATPAWPWTSSPRNSPSSSTRTTTSSKRWPSTGPRGGCGRASCATPSAPTDPRSQMLRFHTQTAGSTLTAQQPHNNIMRVTLQALAAVMGGTQSLHTNSFDEALALPSDESVTIALRTQQVIGYETGLADTADPFAGSFAVESLTDELEAKAQTLMDAVEELGRRGARHRAGLHAARDRGGGLRLPEGHRVGREADRRPERVRERREAGDAAAAGRPGRAGTPGGEARRPAGGAGRRPRSSDTWPRCGRPPGRHGAGAGRAAACGGGPAATSAPAPRATCSTPCVRRSRPTRPWARSATCCATSWASTRRG